MGKVLKAFNIAFGCYVLILALGLLNMLLLGLVQTAHWPAKWELPIVEQGGLVIDHEDRIFLALPTSYSRVQVYDAEGQYLTGFFIEHATKRFGMRLTREGLLQVHARKSSGMLGNKLEHHYLTYNHEGQLLEESTTPPTDVDDQAFMLRKAALGPDKTQYALSGQVDVRVERQAFGGEPRTLIRTPLYVKALTPSPIAIFIFIGLVFFLLGAQRINQKLNPQVAEKT